MRDKLFTKLGIIGITILILSSCHFDHLYYETNTRTYIKLNVDWSKTNSRLNGASVYVYHKDGALYKALPPFSNPYELLIELPKGQYDLMLHNNTSWELPNVEFKGHDSAQTFSVVAKPDEDIEKVDILPVKQPDQIAVGYVRDLTITQEMIDYYPDRPGDCSQNIQHSIDVTPEPIISEITVIVHVFGLKYAANAPSAELRNLSNGYYLMGRTKSKTLIAHNFLMNLRQFYPQSKEDGQIMQVIHSFGFHDNKEQQYGLHLNFKLVNGETHRMVFDVTDKIQQIDSLKYKIELSCKLPEVIDIGGNDSGFNPDVGDWEDLEVDIPIL